MSRRRYVAAAPLRVRVSRLLTLSAPTPAVVRDVLWEHPDGAKLYSEDAADWITDRELSPTFFSGPDHGVMMAELNRERAITEWFRSLGFAWRDICRSPNFPDVRAIWHPEVNPVFDLPALRWSDRCTDRLNAQGNP